MTFPNLYFLIILILLALPTFSIISPAWGIYRWVQSDKSLIDAITQKSIILTHPSSPYLTVQLSTDAAIKQKFNSYNMSVYNVNNNNNRLLQIVSKGGWMQIQAKATQKLSIQIKCIKQQQACSKNKQYLLSELKSNKEVANNCKQTQNKFQCTTTKQAALVIQIRLPKTHKPTTPQTTTQLQQLYLYSTKQFMNNFNITLSPQKLQIVQYALSSLINSICLYKFQQQFCLGLCQQNRFKKWDYNVKFAAFAIYLLADYYYDLAHMVYKDYFYVVESKLLYPLTFANNVLPLPEHIQVFTRFGSVLDLQNQVQLLNSMFVVPMLNQLGTLHEQLNYREAKQLHPLLLKMLQQKWSSNSLRSALKSVYQQSFTQDYKFHNYGQQLQMSTAKCAYLYKVIDTFTGLMIQHHAYFMPVQHIKENLQEHFTLLNIMKVYANDDANAKQGKYKDIINVKQEMKLYSMYNGYESLLPYVYGIGKVYPDSIVKQLETPYGLKSSSQEKREQHERKYRFRGDIHSYFNIKIITGLLHRIPQDKSIPQTRKKQISLQLLKIASSIGNKVLKDFKQNKSIFTSWSAQGKVKQKNEWGKIFTVLFLKWA